MLRDILRSRDLLFMLTMRDIRIRYKQSVMGILWALFMPIMAILAGIFIKAAISILAHKPIELSGIASIAVKTLPWTFFISSLKFSVTSLVSNRDLVTKIYFPREVLPLATLLACLFDFCIASVALTIMLAVAHIGISIYVLLVPVLLIFLIIFTAGLGLLLSSANLFYRDIKYIVEIILMFGIFFTPVFYEAKTFGKWGTILLLNPVGSILESINTAIVLHNMPDITWILYAGLSSIFMFTLGIVSFNKLEPLFAESI